MTSGFRMDKHDYLINDWLIDESANALVHAETGEIRKLGEYQFRLLIVLVEHAGSVLSREDITNMVWVHRVIGSNSLPNAIHALRTALEDDGKKQRIIRTIPKRGYLLSSEYCRTQPRKQSHNYIVGNTAAALLPADLVELQTDFIKAAAAASELEHTLDEPLGHQSSPEESVEEVQVATTTVSVAEEPPGDVKPTSQSVPLQVLNWLRQPLNLSLLLATVVLVFLAGQVLWHEHHDVHLSVNRSNETAFSHIRLYGIEEKGVRSNSKDNLFARLQKTFYTLNTELNERSASMSVYYQALGQSLNYSFIVKGPCSQQQYVMVIHHWRVNTERLNDLILKETRREMHDLATCTKN